MKRKIIAFLLIMILVISNNLVLADTTSDDGLIYNIESRDWDENPDTPDILIAEIIGYEGDNSTLSIPKTVNFFNQEIPVKVIKDRAFKDNQIIRHVSFALDTVNNIEKIYGKAFENCINLESIDIPNTVKLLGTDLFKGCTSLETASLLCEAEELEFSLFEGCSNLKTVNLSNEHLKQINSEVFKNCTNLKILSIPKHVNDISSSAFAGCEKLEAINVDEENDEYTSENGILYTQGKTKLVRFPQNKALATYDVPNTVTHILYYALDDCKQVETINISSNVTNLYDDNGRLFAGSSNLKTINVDENNSNFSSDTGGVLYNKDKSVLLRYPENKVHGANFTSYEVADTVITVIDRAFYGNRNLEEIIFPSNVVEIKNRVFQNSILLSKLRFESDKAVDGINNIGIFEEDPSNNYPEDLIIEGVKDSYAYDFAIGNGFTFQEIGENNAPTVENAIPDASVKVGETWLYTINDDSFNDVDNDQLTYTITSTSSAISYDANNKTISCNATTAGAITVTVKADDGNGASVIDTFLITAIKYPKIITMDVSDIENDSIKLTFQLDESCDYRVIVVGPRDDNNYNGPGWIIEEGSYNGTCNANEIIDINIDKLHTSMIPNIEGGTEYAVCIRVKDNDDNYEIAYKRFTTLKNQNTSIVEKAIMQSKTHNQIVLKNFIGYQYSNNNGRDWQDSPVFQGLTPSTEYSFIQRVKETDTTFASNLSQTTVIKTNSAPTNDTSEDYSYVPIKTIKDAELISYQSKGKDEIFTLEQKDVKVSFNGLAFEKLKYKRVEFKIEELDKTEVAMDKESFNEDLPFYDISIYIDGDKDRFESEENILIQVPLETDLEKHKIVAVYIDDNGNKQVMEGAWSDGVMRFATHHLSNYGFMYVDKTFDDIEFHWAKEAIEALTSRSIIKGKTAKTYDPDANTSIAEFVSLLVRQYNIAYELEDEIISDNVVGERKWYDKNISIAKAKDILPKFYGDNFDAEKEITREEAMYILYQVLEKKSLEDNYNISGKKLDDFTDVDNLSEYAKESAQALIARGLITGNELKELRVSDSLTRAEAAQIMWNLIIKMR